MVNFRLQLLHPPHEFRLQRQSADKREVFCHSSGSSPDFSFVEFLTAMPTQTPRSNAVFPLLSALSCCVHSAITGIRHRITSCMKWDLSDLCHSGVRGLWAGLLAVDVNAALIFMLLGNYYISGVRNNC